MNLIDYDDIPKEELKSLRKKVFRENCAIRWWNVFASSFGAVTGMLIAEGVFPQREDRMGQLIVGCLLAWGLAYIFAEAVVEPRMRRAVKKNKKAKPTGGMTMESSGCLLLFAPLRLCVRIKPHDSPLVPA